MVVQQAPGTRNTERNNQRQQAVKQRVQGDCVSASKGNCQLHEGNQTKKYVISMSAMTEAMENRRSRDRLAPQDTAGMRRLHMCV